LVLLFVRYDGKNLLPSPPTPLSLLLLQLHYYSGVAMGYYHDEVLDSLPSLPPFLPPASPTSTTLQEHNISGRMGLFTAQKNLLPARSKSALFEARSYLYIYIYKAS
jgi:hypothetical protein